MTGQPFCKFNRSMKPTCKTERHMSTPMTQMQQIDANLRRSYQLDPTGGLPDTLADLLDRFDEVDRGAAKDVGATTPEQPSAHVPASQSYQDQPRSPMGQLRNLIQRYGFARPRNQRRTR